MVLNDHVNSTLKQHGSAHPNRIKSVPSVFAVSNDKASVFERKYEAFRTVHRISVYGVKLMRKSPDSIPSLGVMSNESSEANVSRVLFQTPDREGTEVSVGGRIRHQFDVHYSVFGSGSSTASEGFSAQGDPHVEHANFSPYLRPMDSPQAEGIETTHGSYIGEMRLSPEELATIYNIFDASQQSDEESVNDAVTEVTGNLDQSGISWERMMDSLERENATLKEIIQADSSTILKLKTDLSLRQEEEQTTRIDQELFAVQETILSQEDTIQSLRDEIRTLTIMKNGSATVLKNLEQLRLENELLASQIVENETELHETRQSIKHLAVENVELKLVLSKLDMQHSEAGESHSSKPLRSDRSLDYILMTQVAALTSRVSDIERDLEDKFGRRLSLEVEHRDDFVHNVTDESSGSLDRSIILDQNSDEVEVTIDGVVSFVESSPAAQKDTASSQSTKQGAGLCDCFRPLMTVEG